MNGDSRTADHTTPGGLLSGLTVVECSSTPGAAFAAVLAADFGADVIVCEPHPDGSALRRLGSPSVREHWWPVLARNKRSLAVDLRHPESQPLLQRLVSDADMLVRDDSSEGAALAAAAAPSTAVVDVRLYPTGADRPDLWPWSTRPEFAAAASGMMAVTGEADGPAVQPEIPLGDYCAAMMALMLGCGELRAARLADRKPEPVDLALHEALQRMNEWQVVVASAFGKPVRRSGNRYPMNANVGNIFETRDGRVLTVSAATPSVASRLLNMVGGPTLRDDPRFATPSARAQHMDALDAILAEWFARHDADQAMRLVRENDVVVGPVHDAGELLQDEHLGARGDIVDVPGADGRIVTMPAALPFTCPPGSRVQSAGPRLGADTSSVLTGLGYDAAGIERLAGAGVIGV